MTTAQDIVARWKDLATLANGIIPNTLSPEPTPEEILALNDDLRLLAEKVDALVKAYADHFTEYTGERVDPQFTDDQLSNALEGSLLFEIADTAEALCLGRMEAAR